MKSPYHFFLPTVFTCIILSLVAWVAVLPCVVSSGPEFSVERDDLTATIARVDTWLEASWKSESIEPAEDADDLQVFRRIALALVGTPPSLEEIRQFEADESPDRLQ
jgi:hypothetical protein